MCFSGLLRHELWSFSAKSAAFAPKTIGFAQQFLAICSTKRQSLQRKTIGIAMQNDNFYDCACVDFFAQNKQITS